MERGRVGNGLLKAGMAQRCADRRVDEMRCKVSQPL